MANSGTLIKIIKEGRAQLQVPKTVFYNPVQEFNRDLSVLVLKTYLKYNVWHHKNEAKHVTGRGGMMILDALSASGLRSIRYAKELGPSGDIIKKIVANDISEPAAELIKKNIETNNVQDKVKCSLSDANMVMHLSSTSFDDRFHVIDLDPFGTGAQFFDAAVKSIGEGGLLMVTCTDTAVLCGNASESCFARYGSMSLRMDCCHEQALRIILKSIESHASVYGRYIKPLLSISVDFYVRLFVQVFTQQAETKKSASKLGQIYLCKECKTFDINPLGTHHLKEDKKQANSVNLAVKYAYKPAEIKIGNKCVICGGSYSLGGPIWIDSMHNQEFLKLLKQELELPETQENFRTFRRIQGIIHMCCEELDVPLFYDLNKLASTLKTRVPKLKEILSAIVNAGYKVSSTHTRPGSVKTNAPNTVVWDVICQNVLELQHLNVEEVKSELAQRILSRPRENVYDFKHNALVESEAQKLSLLRFQVNPTREWGPKPRPSAKSSTDENHVLPMNDQKNGSDDEPINDDMKNIKKIKLCETIPTIVEPKKAD